MMSGTETFDGMFRVQVIGRADRNNIYVCFPTQHFVRIEVEVAGILRSQARSFCFIYVTNRFEDSVAMGVISMSFPDIPASDDCKTELFHMSAVLSGTLIFGGFPEPENKFSMERRDN